MKQNIIIDDVLFLLSLTKLYLYYKHLSHYLSRSSVILILKCSNHGQFDLSVLKPIIFVNIAIPYLAHLSIYTLFHVFLYFLYLEVLLLGFFWLLITLLFVKTIFFHRYFLAFFFLYSEATL